MSKSSFLIDKRKQQEKFKQEYLYIEERPLEPIPKKEIKEPEEKRGIEIIELF